MNAKNNKYVNEYLSLKIKYHFLKGVLRDDEFRMQNSGYPRLIGFFSALQIANAQDTDSTAWFKPQVSKNMNCGWDRAAFVRGFWSIEQASG